jgi:hypothetical protein
MRNAKGRNRVSVPGLGLIIAIDKTGPRFILEYRKNWTAPIAEAGLLI